MHDSFFRHFVTALIVLVCGLLFYGGYVAGVHDWPWLALVLIPVYALIYKLTSEKH